MILIQSNASSPKLRVRVTRLERCKRVYTIVSHGGSKKSHKVFFIFQGDKGLFSFIGSVYTLNSPCFQGPSLHFQYSKLKPVKSIKMFDQE